MKDRSTTLILVCLVVTALLSAACGSSPAGRLVRADLPRVESPTVSDAQVAQLAAGTQAFAFDLYRVLAAKEDGNLIYSPYSIALAFSMLYAGARGQAEVEMAVDRPFLFAIAARETEAILFVGRVLDSTADKGAKGSPR